MKKEYITALEEMAEEENEFEFTVSTPLGTIQMYYEWETWGWENRYFRSIRDCIEALVEWIQSQNKCNWLVEGF